MKYSAPRGTRDILPDEIYRWQYVERVFAEVCRQFAFSEIRIPTFEATEVFARGVGGSTDIVRKEMYTFLDKSDRSMTLRPEGTAGVVRSFIEQGMSSLPYPVRLYYNLNLFRYERVAKGRYREFHQLGAEAFGAAGAMMDIEMIALLHSFFKRLGLHSTALHINSIGTPACRSEYNKVLREYLRPYETELCGDCCERLAKNPLRVLDCKVDHCHEIARNAPRLLDYLDTESAEHFAALKDGLTALGIPFVIDTDIVRGLDYYTKTVFEFVSENVGTQGTICGGGRYDCLVEEMGGTAVPAVGFALGEERLLMEMAAQQLDIPRPTPTDIYVAPMGENAQWKAMCLINQLREGGIVAQTDLCGRTLKAQMKFADKIGARFVLVLGENELTSGDAELKNMQDGSKTAVRWEDLPHNLNLLR